MFSTRTPRLAVLDTKPGCSHDGMKIWNVSTLDSFWNDLAVQPIFLPFVHQMARYVSGRGETLPWFTAGQVLDVSESRVCQLHSRALHRLRGHLGSLVNAA